MQARLQARTALKRAPTRDVRALTALALALAGDTAGAQTLAAELNQSSPLDTMIQIYMLPTIGAAVALQQNNPSRAVEQLKVASRLEFGDPTGEGMRLWPAYLRGEAHLMQHDGSSAAAEFQKLIDHYGSVAISPWGALARLGLARAYALTLRPTGRSRQSPHRVSRFPHSLERCRSRHPHLPASQSRVRAAALAAITSTPDLVASPPAVTRRGRLRPQT